MLSRSYGSVAAIFAALLIAAAPLAAQTGTIAGQVRDAETLTPVGGVQIEAVTDAGPATGALTGADGRFRFPNLPAGTYTLLVGHIAYAPQRIEGVVVRAGETTEMNVNLVSRALRLNPVVVSVSRREERALDAPASIAIVDSRSVMERPAITPAEHVRVQPGVDIITTGLQSTNLTTRGFNNIFSGSLHMLTDHRIAGIPSLRVNLIHFVPTTDEDIDRMEVVLGPGSALYGPNTANGVLHTFTKSPLDYPGTAFSFAGGEREVVHGVFRTSHALSETFGIKLSGQYLRGLEWEFTDATEQAERQFCDAQPEFCVQRLVVAEGISPQDAQERVARIADRDERIERFSGEVRADWRPRDDMTAVLAAGSNLTANAVELTGLGAGQVKDWRYDFYQARFNWDRLFAQVYLNTSTAGDTYLLRDGSPIVDRSKLLVSQIQHGLSLGERQRFTYGLDLIRTMPETEGTIHGRHEDDDLMTEVGGYLHSETVLSRMVDLVLAGRVDTHSHLDDAVFSPRAALVFKPRETHTFRATFNQAFSTPTAVNLFLDLGTPFPTTGAALSQLGYSIRVQGTANGIRIRQPDGSYLMRSPFTPQELGGPAGLVPASPVLMWQMAAGILRAQGHIDEETHQFLVSRPQSEIAALGINAWDFQADRFQRLDQLDIADVPTVRETNTTTYEIGYKGLLGDRLLVAADVWYSQITDFVTPLMLQTPLLLLHPLDLAGYAAPQLVQHFMERGLPQEQAEAAAGAIISGMAQLPLGVVSSEDINASGAQALMTYRNFGDVSLWGTDLAVQALLTDEWSVGLSASLVSRDHFFSEGQFITLNAPKRKGGVSLGYRNARTGFNSEVRVRHTSTYPASSGVYFGTDCVAGAPTTLAGPCVNSHTLADITMGYQLPGVPGASVQLAVQNLLDDTYQSFPGAPPIGRLALLRLRYEF